MFRSLIDVREELIDSLLYLCPLFKDLYIVTATITFDFRDYGVAPLDPHELVGKVIELFHRTLPQQCPQIMEILHSIDLSNKFSEKNKVFFESLF
jgi:hypothetical protein